MTPSLTNPNPKRDDERDTRRSLSNSDRLRVATSYHREKLPPGFEKELLEFADEWDEELEAASARPSPGDPVRAALEEARHALFNAEGRLALLMEARLPDSDHPVATAHVLSWVRTALISSDAALSDSTPTGEGEARESLKPFVAHYQPWMDEWADDKPCTVFATVTFGDLRRARAAIGSTPSKGSL